MGLSQIAMMLLILGCIGGYWWFKVGRHGGAQGYLRRRLGLTEGEQIASMWMTYYDIDRSVGDRVAEVAGVRKRGINMMVALTTHGRLVIGNNEREEPPRSYQRGEVAITEHGNTAEIGTIAGTGGLEQAHVMAVAPARSEAPFRLQIARSGLQAIMAWASGA